MIVDPDFCDHWKTRMLVGLLDGDELAPTYVLRVWAHCQNRRAWVFENLPAEAIKALCRYAGPAEKLEAAMKTAGYLRRDGQVLTVVGWEEYNATLIAAWKNGGKNGQRGKRDATQHSAQPADPPTGVPTGPPADPPTGPRLDGMGLDEKLPPNPPPGGTAGGAVNPPVDPLKAEAEAKRIAEEYHRATRTTHSLGGGQAAVRRLLLDGVSPETLLAATRAVVADWEQQRRPLDKRNGARAFFGEGGWEAYRNGRPPTREPPGQSAEQVRDAAKKRPGYEPV